MNGRWLATGMGILCVAIILAIGLCVHVSVSQRIPSSVQYAGNVTFLEHNLIANSSVINGSAPFRTVDFPSYWFNANTRELNGEIDFDLYGPLALIYGDALTLKGNFGAGTGNRLYGVTSLPATDDRAIIYYVDHYGDIGMYVNNRSVMLRPGQEYTYHENETARDGNGTVRIDYQHIYLNRGPIARDSIQTRMVT